MKDKIIMTEAVTPTEVRLSAGLTLPVEPYGSVRATFDAVFNGEKFTADPEAHREYVRSGLIDLAMETTDVYDAATGKS